MRDDRFDDRFELELRAALRHELATARVGVAAPQVRGRIAARDRTRRTTRLVLLAAALLAGLLAVPVVGALIRERSVTPPPAGAEPATVVAIEASTGDLVVSNAWPDGRLDEQWRLPGGLERVREALDDPAATGLPADAVAAAGPDGWLAVALPGRDALLFQHPGDTTRAVAGAIGGGGAARWFGWADDGRLVLVGDAATGNRLEARRVDPATGVETSALLPDGVVPDWARGEVVPLTWTGDGRIVARRVDQASFSSTIGSLDLRVDPPTFTVGRPAAVRATTGLEPREGADGSQPATGCEDDRPVSGCAGLRPAGSDQAAVTETWLVVRPEEAVTDVARTADGGGLLVIVRATDADRGRLVAANGPGEWQDAIAFAAPAYSPRDSGLAYVAGVAPAGRSVALWVEGVFRVGDLATGAATTLPPGTVFVGWPTAPTVASEGLATTATCRPAEADDIASITLSAVGAASPASPGAPPLVGDREDADPWHVDEMARAEPVTPEAGGRLVLALPAGVCLDAALVDAIRPDGLPYAVPGQLLATTAGTGVRAELVPVPAPESGGDWIVRARLWLVDTDREAVLLYRVVTPGEAKPVVTPAPTAAPATPPPTPTPVPTPEPTPTPPPAGAAPDSVAVVVATDGLVMRSRPEISDASTIYEPALAEGAELHVWDGPVRASGYDWYRVLPLSAKYQASGWVAAASRDGEPWIQSGRATCPRTPDTVVDLRSTADGLRLACFSGQSITVRARITPCSCSVDPAYAWDPAWFAGVGHREDDLGFGLLLLDEPDARTPPQIDGSTLWLILDPAGTFPEPLPVGEAVEVTGRFDHPAAGACTATLSAEPPEPQPDAPLWCRTSFVATEIR